MDALSPQTESLINRANDICTENEGLLENECRRRAIYERTRPSVVKVNVLSGQNAGSGTGFAIPPSEIFWREAPTNGDFYILTCGHVTNGADHVWVEMSDGREFYATALDETRESDGKDAALLLIHNSDTAPPPAPLPLAAQNTVAAGDLALVYGSPLGLDDTLTAGIVSFVGTRPELGNLGGDIFQLDSAINPGNSGGPALNSRGEVFGISSFILADAAGLGFSHPIYLEIGALFYAYQRKLEEGAQSQQPQPQHPAFLAS